jgi:hypothetical protein
VTNRYPKWPRCRPRQASSRDHRPGHSLLEPSLRPGVQRHRGADQYRAGRRPAADPRPQAVRPRAQ